MLPQAKSPRHRGCGYHPRIRIGDVVVDSMLLVVCLIAMGVLVVAWAMLPHSASRVPIQESSSQHAESGTPDRAFQGQAA